MIQFDEEQVRKRLIELEYPEMVIDMELTGVGNLHDDLKEVFDAWLQGDEKEYAFKGVSLSMIKKKRGCDHLNAMSTMSSFIKDPSLVDDFLSIPDIMARRRYGDPSKEL